MTSQGTKLQDDPRLGRRCQLLDESARHGVPVYGVVESITRFPDGGEIWTVNSHGDICRGASRYFALVAEHTEEANQ